ncbi:unnamed protein product, partial [Medioppia subpectinata]
LSSYDGSEDVNEYLHHPLSKGNCIIGCMAQATMDRCQCWPPELPFMRGSLEDAQENLLKWCDWDGDGLDVAPNQPDKPANATWFQYCFTVHETLCKAKCNSDCKIDRYRIIKEVRQWPSTERIEHSKKGDYLYDMRQCCAIVSIRYWSAEQVINQYQPKFETAEFSSYIGGLLSMWVGFSLLGLYDVIEGIVIYMYKRVKENAQDNNKLGGLTGLNKLAPIIEPIQVFNTNNNTTKYPDPYGNHQLYRQRWRRAARVATIVDRWTHSVPHIVLVGLKYQHFNEMFLRRMSANQTDISLTRYVSYSSSAHILSFTIKKHWSLYKIFKCLNVENYYLLMAAIALLSLVVSLKRRSMKAFLPTLWSYGSVLLSDVYTIQYTAGAERLLAGLWLLVCTVYLAAFAGYLRELLIQVPPIDWIDSLQDLYGKPQWRSRNIQTFRYDDFHVYLYKPKKFGGLAADTARHLHSRLDPMVSPVKLFLDPTTDLTKALDYKSVIE